MKESNTRYLGRSALKLIFIFSIPFYSSSLYAQQKMSLEECISLAKSNNISVKMAEEGVQTSYEMLKISKSTALPKVDVLAGYNYLGSPLEINLDPLKQGIVEGSSRQNMEVANTIFNQITQQDLPQGIQQSIYETSKSIISALYPNYNPQISKQSYLMAGLFVRQPIYLGGKLHAARKIAEQEHISSQINLEHARDFVSYSLTLQYLQVQYLNTMIAKQEEKIASATANSAYAEELLRTEIIPKYQRQWADAALIEDKAIYADLKLEKENALLQMKHLMGMELDLPLDIDNKLPEMVSHQPYLEQSTFNQADLRLLESKREEAHFASSAAKTSRLPNIFALGNMQFFRRDLPIITPPWMLGVELQWNIFDGSERKHKIKMAESIVNQTNLLIDQKREVINLSNSIAANKIKAFKEQVLSLDNARKESYNTTEMIKKRVENSLSSVKDVNDALAIQYGIEKTYYTAIVGYQTALVTYYYLNGNLERNLNIL